jgi:hypothetical protein
VRFLVRYRWTGGSPASIHGVVVVLPSRMEIGAKGKEGQPHWTWAGLRTTVTVCAIFVIFWELRRFGRRQNGKPQEGAAFPQVEAAYTAPSPACNQFVM